MEQIKACRICLDTDVKLYDMFKYRLKSAYENLTGQNMTQSHFFCQVCGFCGMMLDKFTRFQVRCVRSQQLLEILCSERGQVTTDHIKSINRHTHNLTHPYTKQFIQNFDTTINVKEETNELIVKPDIDDITEDCYFDQYDSDHKDTFNNDIENNEDDISKIEDSDEEPLSKKVKKKKHKKTKRERYENDIKSENESNSSKLQVKRKATIDNIDTEHKLVILTKEEQIEEVLLRKMSSNYQNSVYKCDSCYKGFMTESTYKNHMARHDPRAGAARCDVCRTRWPDARALRAHALIAHERKYICKLCGHISRSSYKAKEHVAWHTGATYPCAQCGATFQRSTSYLTHVRLRHPSAYACVQCGQAFIGRNGLNMHRKKAHREKSTQSVFQLHECQSCRIGFENEEALQRHSSLAGETGCDTNARACVQCGDYLATDELLAQHAAQHRAGGARTCAECSRTFANERSLAAHRRRAHGAERPLADRPRNCVCEICGYKCTSSSSLAQHQRRHSGEKPFPCALCPARFSVQQRLQIHVRTHTGERPFQCSRCPKAFKHKAALNRHDRVHTGVKPYTCPQCGKSFSQSNSMKQHCAGVHMKMYIYSRKAANKQTL